MHRYRVGCSGWSYEDWKGPFYPTDAEPKEFLERYARVFDTVEVDSSFYRAPSPFLVRRWASVTPEGFQFTLKIPREVTHEPGPVGTRLDAFLAGLSDLRRSGKLGALVAQFPPSFKRDSGRDRLLEVLNGVPEDVGLAVELRHRSWWVPATEQELAQRGAVLVWSVYPGVDPPAWVTGPFLYARFVGDRALTKFDRIQRDGRPAIETMKRRFEEEGRSAEVVYVLANNHYMGFGPGTIQLVQEVLGLSRVDLTKAMGAEHQSRLDRFGDS